MRVFGSFVLAAAWAVALTTADSTAFDVSVTVDGEESMLHYSGQETPEAAARSFLQDKGLDKQVNYDTHLRAISLDIRRRMNESVDLSWLEKPVATSISVNLGEDKVIEFRVHDGENAQSAAEAFCFRHNLALDNALPLSASIMRKVASEDAPYVLFQMPVTIDNSTNFLNVYSDRIGDEETVAYEFLKAVGIPDDHEGLKNMSIAITENIKQRVEALGDEKQFALEHTSRMRNIRTQMAIARSRAKILSEESGKVTLQFGESTEESRALNIQVDGTNYDIEFPATKTTVDVAISFCEDKWTIVSKVMSGVLEVDISKDDCALILNELMMNQLVAEQERNRQNATPEQ